MKQLVWWILGIGVFLCLSLPKLSYAKPAVAKCDLDYMVGALSCVRDFNNASGTCAANDRDCRSWAGISLVAWVQCARMRADCYINAADTLSGCMCTNIGRLYVCNGKPWGAPQYQQCIAGGPVNFPLPNGQLAGGE